MPYTFWHRGILIGETEFERDNEESAAHPRWPHHLAGVFHPTAHGQHLLPRLCGMLTACADLKEELVRRGLNPDESPPEMLSHLFETTAAGAHIMDIGRVLSEVELRAPSGVTLQVSSMGFMDLTELGSLSRRLGCNDTVNFEEVPSEVAEFIVSVTLRDLTPHRLTNTLLQ